MANHVNTYVQFENLSEAGAQRLQELYSRIKDSWMGDLWVDGAEGSPTEEETQTYNWMVNNVGAKWAHIEDMDESGFLIMSAWSVPISGIEWIFDRIAEVDKEFTATVTYEDEMPNFAGAAFYTAEGQFDMEEFSDDEIRYRMHQNYEGMAEHWNAEEEEGDDEYWEMFSDNVWDEVNQMQFEEITAFKEAYQEYLMEKNNDV